MAICHQLRNYVCDQQVAQVRVRSLDANPGNLWDHLYCSLATVQARSTSDSRDQSLWSSQPEVI